MLDSSSSRMHCLAFMGSDGRRSLRRGRAGRPRPPGFGCGIEFGSMVGAITGAIEAALRGAGVEMGGHQFGARVKKYHNERATSATANANRHLFGQSLGNGTIGG